MRIAQSAPLLAAGMNERNGGAVEVPFSLWERVDELRESG